MNIKEQAAHTIELAKKFTDDIIDPIALAVAAIETDISDRRGLKHEWDEIDDEVKDEIRSMWAEIIKQATT